VDARKKAYSLAKEAAELDFTGAVQGLLAGHEEKMRRLHEAMSKKDMAFLMALALSEKGARIDKDGVMAKAIKEGLLAQPSLCEAERKFLERTQS